MGQPVHFLNGKLVQEKDFVVSVRDLGFARGYAVFDFLITYPKRRPFMLSRHIDRLFNSAAAIDLSIPWSKQQVSQWVVSTLIANEESEEKAIKIYVSGGISSSLLPQGEPTIAILVDPLIPPPQEYYEKGVGAITVKHHRYTPNAKTTNYTEGVKQAQIAQKSDSIEPIYYDDTQVFEGSTSNVFALVGSALLTPRSRILEGITRGVLLEIVKLDIPVKAEDFTIEDLRGAAEVFFTGSNKEVMPITRIDGRAVGSGEVGAVTKECMRQFREFTRSDRW